MPTFLYNRLAAILLQEQLLLQEAPLNPAQMKTKLGIKAIAISDEDMQQFMDITQDKKQLVALVKFAIETKDLPLVVTYAQKMMQFDPKLDPQRFATFIKFTEYIDGKETARGYKKSSNSFELDSQPPDWQSQDGRYRVYDAKDMSDCIKYGHGQTFCISRSRGNNLYYHYRSVGESKFYFVFDTSLDPKAETYITVVDVKPNGKCEFTHKSNTTPATSEKYGYSLDKFLNTKPGLQAGKSIFQAVPLTSEEKAEHLKWEQVNDNQEWETLSREEMIKFIRFGKYALPVHVIEKLDDQQRDEYVQMHGNNIRDFLLPLFNDKQKLRIIKGYGGDIPGIREGRAEHAIEFVCAHLDKFQYSLNYTSHHAGFDGDAPANNDLYPDATFEVAVRAKDPLYVLKQFQPKAWEELLVHMYNYGREFMQRMATELANVQAWVGYLGEKTVHLMGDLVGGDGILEALRADAKNPGKLGKMVNNPTLSWKSLVGYGRSQATIYEVSLSKYAFNIWTNMMRATGLGTNELLAQLAQGGNNTKPLEMSIALSSPNPLQAVKAMHLDNSEYNGAITEKFSTILFAPGNEELLKLLVNSEVLDVDALLWCMPKQQDLPAGVDRKTLYQGWKARIEAIQNPAQALAEGYLARFKKILNS